MRCLIFPLHLSKLVRLPQKRDSRSYDLSRKMASANLKIWNVTPRESCPRGGRIEWESTQEPSNRSSRLGAASRHSILQFVWLWSLWLSQTWQEEHNQGSPQHNVVDLCNERMALSGQYDINWKLRAGAEYCAADFDRGSPQQEPKSKVMVPAISSHKPAFSSAWGSVTNKTPCPTLRWEAPIQVSKTLESNRKAMTVQEEEVDTRESSTQSRHVPALVGWTLCKPVQRVAGKKSSSVCSPFWSHHLESATWCCAKFRVSTRT